MSENFAEQIIEDVEDLFHPKPGGIVDRHRQERARREAAEQEAENVSQRVEEASYKAVKVAVQSPEVFSPAVFTIGPGGDAQILPLSRYRSRATILVVTAASSIILAKDNGASLSANGLPLPTGIPFTVNGRGQLWAHNPGGATVQVGVLSELYAPEQ